MKKDEKGPGWHKERARHREAALKGHRPSFRADRNGERRMVARPGEGRVVKIDSPSNHENLAPPELFTRVLIHAGLSPMEAQVAVMTEYGMKPKEIADRIGVSQPAVNAAIKRGQVKKQKMERM